MISITLDLFVLIGKFIVALTQNIAQYIRILFFSKSIWPYTRFKKTTFHLSIFFVLLNFFDLYRPHPKDGGR